MTGFGSCSIIIDAGCRAPPVDLPDDLWTRISIEFDKDATGAVLKALVEWGQRILRANDQRLFMAS
jgi:hypothetical protein